MTDYNELVRVLRCKRDDCEGCDLAFFDKDEGWMCRYAAKDDDAADAIEELQKALADEYKESEYVVNELESCVRTLAEQRDFWKDKAENIEPKRGEWIITTETSDDGAVSHHMNCSVCGFYWREPKHRKVFKRCPNCGADMRAKMEVQNDKA